ncbi:hypothetical protein F1559_001279 [Cyanidiococcus yangmingshanensis]|uniref:Glycosyltransferase subfamily 4-like N-terminal domain-containing protein n=1 Tax=Cyanidiococcus yangmingshanensis TaxID=2690220 RepID=A0A7J7IC57_9RHOD|nr:hypothetical protein F1559_001279 [Cyanidiococcus yangmingshanensis]
MGDRSQNTRRGGSRPVTIPGLSRCRADDAEASPGGSATGSAAAGRASAASVPVESPSLSAQATPVVGSCPPEEAIKRDSQAGMADEVRRAASASAAPMPSPEELAKDMERARLNTISLKRVESEPEVAPLKLTDQLIFSTPDGYRQAEQELLTSARSSSLAEDSAAAPSTESAVMSEKNSESSMDRRKDMTASPSVGSQGLSDEGPAITPGRESSETERENSNPGPKCPRRYRIALFAWESLYSVAVGGVAPHVTELAAGLERRGHEVHVFVRSGMGQPSYERIDGVYVHRCGFDGSPDFVKECENMCNSFMHAMYEVECFMNARFDVIHCHDWLAGFALTNAKYVLGRPVCIFTVHSTEYGRSGNNHYGGQSARIRDIEQAAISAADRVICVSGVLCDEVKAVYSFDWNKLRCVHNGINALRYDGNLWDPGEVRARYGVGPARPNGAFCRADGRSKRS